MSLLYFAYGSNMSSRRIVLRVPSARPLGRACLIAHRLAFHKRGMDGSGKCDAVRTGKATDVVHGVIYRLDSSDLPQLDQAEGVDVGYRRRTVCVTRPDGRNLEAFTYLALLVDKGLRPFTWYLRHVLEGAREHGLPAWYRERIAVVRTRADSDSNRAAREGGIYVG